MELKYRVISEIDDFCSIAEQWDCLLEVSDANSIFLTYDWISTWVSISDIDLSICTITIYDNEKLVGIAPFYKSSLRLCGVIKFNCLRIMGDNNSSAEYQDLIIHPGYESAVIGKIAEAIRELPDKNSFFWVPYSSEQSGASDRFQKLFKLMSCITRDRGFEYYKITLPKTKTDFDRALTSKQRNNIRRYKKKLTQNARIEAVNLADHESANVAVAILKKLHNLNWNARGQEGVFDRKPQFKSFITAYSKIAKEKHQLMAICLIRENEPIAIRFGYHYNSVFYELQAGYNPDYNGSGICAIDFAIEFAIKNEIGTYDFLAFAGDYKQRFNAQPQPGRSYFASCGSLFPRLVNYLGFWPTGKYISV